MLSVSSTSVQIYYIADNDDDDDDDDDDANSHGFTVRLTVWGINSRSHDLASKSHGESENLEIAKQFR